MTYIYIYIIYTCWLYYAFYLYNIAITLKPTPSPRAAPSHPGPGARRNDCLKGALVVEVMLAVKVPNVASQLGKIGSILQSCSVPVGGCRDGATENFLTERSRGWL